MFVIHETLENNYLFVRTKDIEETRGQNNKYSIKK